MKVMYRLVGLDISRRLRGRRHKRNAGIFASLRITTYYLRFIPESALIAEPQQGSAGGNGSALWREFEPKLEPAVAHEEDDG